MYSRGSVAPELAVCLGLGRSFCSILCCTWQVLFLVMTKELTPCNLIFFINAIACRANSPTSSGKSIVEIEKNTSSGYVLLLVRVENKAK